MELLLIPLAEKLVLYCGQCMLDVARAHNACRVGHALIGVKSPSAWDWFYIFIAKAFS